MNRVNRIDDDLVSKGAEIAESQNSTLSTLSKPFRRHPAELGKLHEIDLGPSTTKENVVRTEVAAMRLNTGSDTTPSAPPGREARNTGPSPKRRKKMPKTTTDLYRDKLVEEVCTESRSRYLSN